MIVNEITIGFFEVQITRCVAKWTFLNNFYIAPLSIEILLARREVIGHGEILGNLFHFLLSQKWHTESVPYYEGLDGLRCTSVRYTDEHCLAHMVVSRVFFNIFLDQESSSAMSNEVYLRGIGIF